jgi:hypothetical protein
MSTDAKPDSNPLEHGDYERKDLSAASVFYFLVGVAVLCFVSYLIVTGFYKFLDARARTEQPEVSPLATKVPTDTRKLPEGYKDREGYERYLKDNFPAPQLEINERTELNKDRIAEEEKLNSYGYVDDSHTTVRIPIDRAMDLIAQSGLPVRSQSSAQTSDGHDAAPPKAAAKAAKKGSSQ